MLSCNTQPIIGFVDFNIITTGDDSGTQSARARINYTNMTFSSTSTTLSLIYSNPEGDELNISLNNNGDLSNSSYNIGSGATVSGIVHVTSDLNTTAISIDASAGIVNVLSLSQDGADLKAVITLEFNIESGGQALGQFDNSSVL